MHNFETVTTEPTSLKDKISTVFGVLTGVVGAAGTAYLGYRSGVFDPSFAPSLAVGAAAIAGSALITGVAGGGLAHGAQTIAQRALALVR